MVANHGREAPGAKIRSSKVPAPSSAARSFEENVLGNMARQEEMMLCIKPAVRRLEPVNKQHRLSRFEKHAAVEVLLYLLPCEVP